MNRALFGIVFSLCLLCYTVTLSQAITFDQKRVPLDKVLSEIESKFKVHFAYDPLLCSKYSISNILYSEKWEEQIEEALFQTPFRLIEQNKGHYVVVPDVQKEAKINSQGYYEEPIKISGHITDIYSQEALTGVSIILMPDGISVDSDHSGHFFLKSKSRYAKPWIDVRYLGYENQRKLIVAPCDTQMQIKLFPNLHFLQAVVVKDIYFEPIDLKRQGQSQKIEPIKFTTPLFADPLRSVQQLSGVNATNDMSSQLQIRGSQADENSIRIDEMNLYSVDHFYGLFSNINPFLISEIDVYKSYFPSQYGGKTSSLILMKTPTQDRKFNGAGEISFLNTNAFLQIPLLKRADLLIAGRISNRWIGQGSFLENIFSLKDTTDVVERSADENISVQPQFKFYDYYSKLRIPVWKNLNIFASFFTSEDQTKTQYNAQSQFMRQRFSESYRDSAKWENLNYQFGLEWKIGSNGLLKTHYSKTSINSIQGVDINIVELTMRPPILEQDKYDLFNAMKLDNILLEYNLIKDKNTHTIGIEGNISSTESKYLQNTRRIFIDNTNNLSEWSVYNQHQFKFHNRWLMDLGIRISKYNLKDYLDFSPRLNLEYRWSNNWTTILRSGIYYQYLRQYEFEDRFGRRFNFWTNANEKNRPSIKSFQTEFVQKINLGKYVVSFEAFYKEVGGVLEQLNERRPLQVQTIDISGDATFKGLELNIERDWKHGSIKTSYSYLDAKNIFSELFNGEAYPVPFTSEHQIKLNTMVKFKKLRWENNSAYGSPQSYSVIRFLPPSEPGGRSIAVRELKRLDFYLRWDTRILYNFIIGKTEMEAKMAIYNLFDRENVKYNQDIYNVAATSGKRIITANVNLLPRTYDIALKIKF